MAFYGNLNNIYKVTSIQKIEHPFKNQHLKKTDRDVTEAIKQ